MPFETSYLERSQYSYGFFLLLWDACSKSADLLGDVTVRAGRVSGKRRGESGVFEFPPMQPGATIFAVESGPWTPYYRRAEIAIDFPVGSALWPAYPDLNLADRDLRLDDPAQPAAYREQRDRAALLPAAAYPFDGSATLARGTVLNGGEPLAGATVSRVGGIEVPFVTGADGQFVLFFPGTTGLEKNATLRAAHPDFPDRDVPVTLVRGTTVSARFDM